MLKSLFLGACVTSCAFALPTLSGIVQDTTKDLIDGAKITVWDAATGKGVQTSTTMGSFSLSGVAQGDYLFKVEKDSRLPVFGAFHLGDGPHQINVVMLSALNATDTAGAGSSLRDSVRPPRSSPKPPRVKPAQVKKKVMPAYPDSERKSGLAGIVKIAMIILPDGTVDDLVVLSGPDGNLATAALLAVRLWRYSPTYLDNEPVEASLTVNVNFVR